MQNSKTYTTHDISLAAYLLMKGKKLLSATRDHSGKYILVFDDPDGTSPQMALDFLSSECSMYDGYMRLLRGILRNP